MGCTRGINCPECNGSGSMGTYYYYEDKDGSFCGKEEDLKRDVASGWRTIDKSWKRKKDKYGCSRCDSTGKIADHHMVSRYFPHYFWETPTEMYKECSHGCGRVEDHYDGHRYDGFGPYKE